LIHVSGLGQQFSNEDAIVIEAKVMAGVTNGVDVTVGASDGTGLIDNEPEGKGKGEIMINGWIVDARQGQGAVVGIGGPQQIGTGIEAILPAADQQLLPLLMGEHEGGQEAGAKDGGAGVGAEGDRKAEDIGEGRRQLRRMTGTSLRIVLHD
jgi:hypothetical protein